METDKPNVGSRKLAQVAIVVKDIVEARRRWSDLLGVEPPEIVETAPGHVVNSTYRGKPSDDRAKLAFFDLGGVQLELIEPLGTESAWYEGLDRRGEGVHHLAFWVDDMKSSARFLDERDVPMIQRGDMGEGQYVYFDGQERFGTMLELLERKRTPLD